MEQNENMHKECSNILLLSKNRIDTNNDELNDTLVKIEEIELYGTFWECKYYSDRRLRECELIIDDRTIFNDSGIYAGRKFRRF